MSVTMRNSIGRALVLGTVAALTAVSPAAGQARGNSGNGGAGQTGPTVLQLTAGSRAAALSGAYTALGGDADALFFNPAALPSVERAASLSYLRYIADVTLGSAAGVARVGPVSVGLGVQFLDAGEIEETIPDPVFGGERGTSSGSIGASETAVRLALGAPLFGDRVRLGVGAGFALSDLAGVGCSAPVFDAGMQLPIRFVELGAALRNAGGALECDEGGSADLPTEAAVGGAMRFAGPGGLGLVLSADYITRLNDEDADGLAAGVEVGFSPGLGRIGGALRAGYGTSSAGNLTNALTLGGGLSMGRVALDYGFQNAEDFGATHRLGVRWVRTLPAVAEGRR